MKLQGFLKGKGKVGNLVISTVGGETIARDYNPNVSNPNTTAQVNQRAKMKLMSQVAAALSPVIAIPKDGLKSSRNLFVKENFKFASANSGVAEISYENIQLTKGTTGIPAVQVTRSTGNVLTLKLAASAAAAADKVVYVVYKKSDENQFQLLGSKVVEEAGNDGLFSTSMSGAAGELVIWAYGMQALSSAASAKYDNYSVASAVDVARLIANRSLSTSDYKFTQTRGTTLFSGESEGVVAGDNEVMVYISAQTGGTVSGDGFTNGRKAVEIGTSVTVHATATTGYNFLGWYINGTNTQVATTSDYTFTANAMTDLQARFQSTSDDPDEGVIS